MNSAAARPLIAQGVIGLSVCLGGYAAIVLPLRERVGAVRADLAQAEAQAREAQQLEASMAAVMDRMTEAQKRADAIIAAGALARSQEALYTVVNARAAELGVRIDEFAPVQPSGAGSAPGASDRSVAMTADVVLRCRFVAAGSYGQIARLLEALTGQNEYTMIRSVRLWPASGAEDRLVRAEVETEHYAVDPTPHTPPVAGPVIGAVGGTVGGNP